MQPPGIASWRSTAATRACQLWCFPDGSTLTEPSDQELRGKLGALGYEVGPPSLWDRLLALLQSPLIRMFAAMFLIVGALDRDPRLLAAGAVILAASYLAQFLGSRR